MRVPERPDKLCGEAWEEPKEKVGMRLVGEEAVTTLAWDYPLRDESRRSFAGYVRGALLETQCLDFFQRIRDGTAWRRPETRLGLIPRKTCWMVKKGCSCSYRYGGIEVEPEEFPAWMTELLHILMPRCGIVTPAEWPNSCNLNLYDDGGMSVGWHADDERLFQGRFQNCRIFSLSLGVERHFELRLTWPDEGEKSLWRFVLGSGDLLTMEGMMQKHFQHRVPREDNVNAPRINLTWRWIARHSPQCACSRPRLD